MKKLALVVLAALFLGGCNRLDNHQPLTSHKLYFSKTDEISQSFLSHADSLNIISICLRNPDRTLIPLQFVLEDEAGTALRRLDFTGGNIDNTDCTKFQFEPVADSQDKRYSAHIVVKIDPGLEPRVQAGLRSGLYAEAHGGGDYVDGTASENGLDSGYDLHFKTSYRQAWRDVVSESVAQFGRRLTQDPAFLLPYLLLLIWTLTRLWRAK